jgi:hypothetical protein
MSEPYVRRWQLIGYGQYESTQKHFAIFGDRYRADCVPWAGHDTREDAVSHAEIMMAEFSAEHLDAKFDSRYESPKPAAPRYLSGGDRFLAVIYAGLLGFVIGSFGGLWLSESSNKLPKPPSQLANIERKLDEIAKVVVGK